MMQTAEIETTRPVIRIVDDDEVFLASQKFFFETFFPEVRVWPCAKRYLDEEDLSAPGCLILDYRMPDRSGLEVQRALLLRRKPMLPIIFLSAHGDIGTAVHAMRNGAVDFLEKPVEPEALLAKVRTAVAWSLDAFKREHDRRRMERQVLSLTGREREVIDLAVKGMQNKEIADLLGISVTTVKMYRALLFKNLASIRFWLRRSFLRVRKTPWSSEHDHQTSALCRHFGINSRPLLVRASGNPRRSRCNCRRGGISRLERSGFCA